MAEENITQENTPPAFNEEKLSELIKNNVQASMSSLEEKLVQNTPRQVPVQNTEDTDFWDTIINPKVDKKVSQANLQAELAQDAISFYTSDDWNSEVEQWLVEEDPDKRKAEKAAIRAEVEKISKNLASTGRGIPRADIFNAVLGEKIKKDRTKFVENIGKKHKATQDSELEKARRGVDISTTLVDFTPESVHKSSWEDVEKTYGGIAF